MTTWPLAAMWRAEPTPDVTLDGPCPSCGQHRDWRGYVAAGGGTRYEITCNCEGDQP
jgi:hypothetical protein